MAILLLHAVNVSSAAKPPLRHCLLNMGASSAFECAVHHSNPRRGRRTRRTSHPLPRNQFQDRRTNEPTPEWPSNPKPPPVAHGSLAAHSAARIVLVCPFLPALLPRALIISPSRSAPDARLRTRTIFNFHLRRRPIPPNIRTGTLDLTRTAHGS